MARLGITGCWLCTVNRGVHFGDAKVQETTISLKFEHIGKEGMRGRKGAKYQNSRQFTPQHDFMVG